MSGTIALVALALAILALVILFAVGFRAATIRGVANEFYPCKPDIFEQTYEAVEA